MKHEKEIDRNKVRVGIEGSEFVEMESSVVTSPLLISFAVAVGFPSFVLKNIIFKFMKQNDVIVSNHISPRTLVGVDKVIVTRWSINTLGA